MKIKKNDTVLVIAGNARGKTGKVLKIFPAKDKVIVEGVNIIKRHTKPSQKNPHGGIVQKEAPIHVSNIMFVDPRTNEATRLGVQRITDEKTGKQHQVRMSKKSGEMVV
jgi:large subunit ribosomal protein L24